MHWLVPTGIAAASATGAFLIARRAFAASTATWDLGPPAKRTTITSGWGDDRSYRGPGAKHEGIDVAAAIGTPLYAVGTGVVAHVDTVADSFAGRWIAIQHAHGLVSQYMHLTSITVGKGQRVRRGQLVGTSGNTANPVFTGTAPHLHLTLRLAALYLPRFAKLFGVPVGGFGARNAWGTAIPAETLVPAHAIAQRVLERAAKRSVRLAPRIVG